MPNNCIFSGAITMILKNHEIKMVPWIIASENLKKAKESIYLATLAKYPKLDIIEFDIALVDVTEKLFAYFGEVFGE